MVYLIFFLILVYVGFIIIVIKYVMLKCMGIKDVCKGIYKNVFRCV